MVRVRVHRLKNCNVLHLLILGFLFLVPSNLYCNESAPPLLLSLDVERDSDVEALEKIGLKEPATYFVTGEFAGKFPQIINDLSKTGTIGSHSHSHPNLTELSLEDVRKDLQTSSKAIEYSTGYAPVWFRAPFLEVNDNVLAVDRDLGFLYDSSEPERWVQQQILNEFPIYINDTGRILFSDYDFFSSYALDDIMALELLKENYLFRLNTGRPFVFLLHPSIISEHIEVLHQFIGFVKDQGGSCLSFDQYLKNIQEKPLANNIGVRIDLSLGDLDIDHTIKE
jgi:peptidoglycan/xylan/chitin deacetylase (PgdA/CDA1 family)